MYGIDVSENNGEVDWQTVKAAGYDFVFIRCGYGINHEDSMFVDNVNAAHEAGLKVGAYWYSYALTSDEAVEEAENCKAIIDNAGCLLELPVFFDIEDADGYKARNGFDADCTEICKAFIDNIGLDCGIYANLDWLTNRIDWRSLGCAVWNAEWGDSDSINGYAWQYTDQAVIGGKYFDANVINN